MRIDNNQAIDSYGVATLRPTDERWLGVIPQRRHDVSPVIVSPSGASWSVRLFLFCPASFITQLTEFSS